MIYQGLAFGKINRIETMIDNETVEKAKALNKKAKELYNEAKESGIGCAIFIDTADDGFRTYIVGDGCKQGISNGYELLINWLSLRANKGASLVFQLSSRIRRMQ